MLDKADALAYAESAASVMQGFPRSDPGLLAEVALLFSRCLSTLEAEQLLSECRRWSRWPGADKFGVLARAWTQAPPTATVDFHGRCRLHARLVMSGPDAGRTRLDLCPYEKILLDGEDCASIPIAEISRRIGELVAELRPAERDRLRTECVALLTETAEVLDNAMLLERPYLERSVQDYLESAVLRQSPCA